MSFSISDFILEAQRQDHSKEFIQETTRYANNLIEKRYPVIFSLEHLAMLMGVESDYLRILTGEPKNNDIYHPYKDYRYNFFKLKKQRGGFREIMAPSKDLKYLQKWIAVNILNNYNLSSSCRGFRKNVSIADNASPHERADIILKIDLLKFYDTITEKRIYGVFKSMGYANNLAVSLAKLTTAKHRPSYWKSFSSQDKQLLGVVLDNLPSILPQGAPSSPSLSNIVATKLDIRLLNLSHKLGFQYTRYADDMTFSVKDGARLPSLRLIKKIINEEGFVVNPEKIYFLNRGRKQYVTGLTTTNGVNVSRRYRKEISSNIYYSRKYGVRDHLKRISGHGRQFQGILGFHDWLLGHICFIQSINREAGDKLLSDFNKINWRL